MGIYKAVLRARHRAYDNGRKEVLKAAAPTICVGNVTVGGTGKTPHTEMILRLLEGRRLAVLSRGYGRRTKGYLDVDPAGDASTFGDEPLQIARKFPGVRVAVDEDRVEGCTRLGGADLVVLDDAFQYRRLGATLNIVLVDFNRPVFEDRLLPFGSLRDLPERIFKADVIIVSKCPSDVDKAAFARRLRLSGFDPSTHRAQTPDGRSLVLLFTRIVPGTPYMVFPEGDPAFARGGDAVVVSGIANNTVFKEQVALTHNVVKMFSFRDHHRFSKADFRAFARAAKDFPAAGFAATEKDCPRLSFLAPEVKRRIFSVPVEAEFLSESERELFLDLLEDVVKGSVQADDVL